MQLRVIGAGYQLVQSNYGLHRHLKNLVVRSQKRCGTGGLGQITHRIVLITQIVEASHRRLDSHAGKSLGYRRRRRLRQFSQTANA